MDNPIFSYRRSKGLTLEQFAKLCGVQKAAVWKWERGGPGPSPLMVLEIEQVTAGAIKRWELRPDLWEASGEAAE